jgi:ribosomal peptide maturation radical SAM protein 1
MNKHNSDQIDVLFCTMPFGNSRHPALGLTLLRAALDGTDVRSKIEYFTLDFARDLGPETYDEIAESAPELLIGEWIFSEAAFEDSMPMAQFQQVVGVHTVEFWEKVKTARREAASFIERCAEVVINQKPRVLGLTSTFQQHVASLALAKRVKSTNPEILTIIGGANCEGPMGREILSQCTYIDAIASGESDASIVPVMQSVLAEGFFPANVPGLFTRANFSDLTHPDVNAVAEMDSLPFVHFDDFLERYDALCDRSKRMPNIMFETSRGCWWGQKHHCTFCGLNGGSMAFRSKSAPRALEELDKLVARHPGLPVSVVDNILDMRYFQDFLPELASREQRATLFYETKANLRRDQVRLLRDAGVTMIQPGIESLSTHVLKIMRKGISMLQNVQLLKWCREFGVSASWNVLYSFPGEDPKSYEEMAELIPLLTHLQPPNGVSEIRLDRFSPNFESAETHGFADVRPYPAYNAVYPFGSESVGNLAYFFTYSHANGTSDFSYFDECSRVIGQWKSSPADLFSISQLDNLIIGDTRKDIGTPVATVLRGARRRIYELCDSVRSLKDLESDQVLIAGGSGPAVIEQILNELLAQKLMICEGNQYLALAVPVGDYGPEKEAKSALIASLRQLGTGSREIEMVPA